MPKKGIPKGWVGCPKNANHLIASKFMSIKTPLYPKYTNHLPFEDIFPPETIFLKAKRNNVRFWLQ